MSNVANVAFFLCKSLTFAQTWLCKSPLISSFKKLCGLIWPYTTGVYLSHLHTKNSYFISHSHSFLLQWKSSTDIWEYAWWQSWSSESKYLEFPLLFFISDFTSTSSNHSSLSDMTPDLQVTVHMVLLLCILNRLSPPATTFLKSTTQSLKTHKFSLHYHEVYLHKSLAGLL